jgi:hypothetical protein
MNQYYLLQTYGNPISIEYFKNNISEDLAYDITTRFPSWRVKIVLGENIELKLMIKKIIATESKMESLKDKMSRDYTVFYKNKDTFISVTDFDDDDTHEYIYELESIDTPIPESPKNQKKEIDKEKISTKNKNIHSRYNLLHTFYHSIVIISVIYIVNYVL